MHAPALRLLAALLLLLLAAGAASAGDPPPPSEDAPPKLHDEEIPVRREAITLVIDATAPDLARLREEACRAIASLGARYSVRIHVLGATARSWRERPVVADEEGRAAAIEFLQGITPEAPCGGTIVLLGGRTASGEEPGKAFLQAQRDAPLLARLDAAFEALAAPETPLRRSRLLAARAALGRLGSEVRAAGYPGVVLDAVRGVRSRAAVPLLLAALVRFNQGDPRRCGATSDLAHALVRLTGEPCALERLQSGGAEVMHAAAVDLGATWLARGEAPPVDLARMPQERLATIAAAILEDVEAQVRGLDVAQSLDHGLSYVIRVEEVDWAFDVLARDGALAAPAVAEADLAPALIPALLELSRERRHHVSAAAVLSLLRRRGQAGALDAILAAEEAHFADRCAAAIALWAAGEPLPTAPLVTLAGVRSTREVRLLAIRLLGSEGDAREAAAALAPLARSPEWDLRRMAAVSLLRRDARAGTEAVLALLAAASGERHGELIDTLMSIRLPEARDAIGDRLEALARAEPWDGERIEEAVRGLAHYQGLGGWNMSDPRGAARDALEWWRARVRSEDAPTSKR